MQYSEVPEKYQPNQPESLLRLSGAQTAFETASNPNKERQNEYEDKKTFAIDTTIFGVKTNNDWAVDERRLADEKIENEIERNQK